MTERRGEAGRPLPWRALFSPPPEGRSRPPTRFRRVVLPEPDRPTTAKNTPAGISRLTPSTARTRSPPLPKWGVTSSSRTRGAATLGALPIPRGLGPDGNMVPFEADAGALGEPEPLPPLGRQL